MIKSDRWTGLFFVLFSLYVCFESWRLGIGSLFRPGAGFFPFYASVLLGALSLTMFVFSCRGETKISAPPMDAENTVTVSLAVLAFALLLIPFGFVLTTFLFVFFLMCVVERRGWLFSTMTALVISAAFYVVFGVWLGTQLPPGVLGW